MTVAGTVTVRVEVAVDAATAFDVFTAEAEAWYRDTPYSWNDPERAKAFRIEPGVGGRVLEVWDIETGEGFEWGRVRVWEPPTRLVFSYRSADMPVDPVTEIEVLFEPIDSRTRVTPEHRGWDRLPPEVAIRKLETTPHGLEVMLRWFADHVASTKRG
ncbi:MAG: SRPBCC domain-containing protein [Acidimicrobiales bacterium]